MNRLLIIASLLFFVGCKSGRVTVGGKPSIKKSKDLIEKIEENRFDKTYVKIKGRGIYINNNEEQAFKIEIRIKKDSVIWIEFSDPVIGIKVGRAFVTKDSIAFLNKIDNTYMAGNLGRLNQELKANLDFELLQSALLGMTLRNLDKTENHQMIPLENFYSFYYLPEKDPLFSFGQPNYYFEIEPTHFQVLKQVASDGGHKFSAAYADYKSMGNKSFLPTRVEVEIAFNNSLKLQLQYNNITVDQKLKFPFKISSKYTKID